MDDEIKGEQEHCCWVFGEKWNKRKCSVSLCTALTAMCYDLSKGITGKVTLDGAPLGNWTTHCLPLEPAQIDALPWCVNMRDSAAQLEASCSLCDKHRHIFVFLCVYTCVCGFSGKLCPVMGLFKPGPHSTVRRFLSKRLPVKRTPFCRPRDGTKVGFGMSINFMWRSDVVVLECSPVCSCRVRACLDERFQSWSVLADAGATANTVCARAGCCQHQVSGWCTCIDIVGT